ncbi:MAG: hypothetical protein WCS56_03050 [Bacilli bacterium]
MRKIYILIAILVLLGIVGCKRADSQYTTEDSNTDSIAILSIYSYNGESESKYFIYSLGHSFMSIENITSSDITFFNYTLSPAELITFSWWGINRHMGIWFNMESNYINLYNRYTERYSVDTYLTETGINAIEEYMESNDYYTPFKNCAKMTVDCWNEVSPNTIDLGAIATPSKLLTVIKKFPNFQYEKEIKLIEKIGYFKGTEFIQYEMEQQNA